MDSSPAVASDAHLVLSHDKVPPGSSSTQLDLICFSHLRWHFVTQRPQHLLTRAAHNRRVFYWEEPVWHSSTETEVTGLPFHEKLEVIQEAENVWIVKPHLCEQSNPENSQRLLLDDFLKQQKIGSHISWYYTPMALSFSDHLESEVTVYDCMDELSGFLGAPAEISIRERELFGLSDVVFTGGVSLFEAKRKQHQNVHPFPSSIDQQHFAVARNQFQDEPSDQKTIPHPRAGFFGVVDERFDIKLLAEVATLRPKMNFIILGPVVKIDFATLPKADNIHYLGAKSYQELPKYLAGWDVAILPFALNDATRYISPTKTPEYLAAGKPVVSTPIVDVIRSYGESGLVAIAGDAQSFADALDQSLVPQSQEWYQAVQEKLDTSSWDSTWRQMDFLIKSVLEKQIFPPCPTSSERIPRNRKASHLATAVSSKACFDTVLRQGPPRHTRTEHFDYVVVGAGFAGSVVAERLASQLDRKVLVVDRRDHIGGNAYDHYNSAGILVHKYGPHIFHTNSEDVVKYLSKFTAWRPYEHRVLSQISGHLLPVPINLDTINRLYNLSLDAEGMRSFLQDRAIKNTNIRTSEDIVLSRVGRELYELFFRNYTRKQWGLDPSQLDASVAGRIPVRFDRDDRYFGDTFQAMPLHGFTSMFERMLDHSKITVRIGTCYEDVLQSYPKTKIVYTGPIDEYFGFRFGPLPYRSLEFRHETLDVPVYQSAPVINYPNEHAYTRVTEFKYLTGQHHRKTSIVYEFPKAEGEPYYPIPRPENTALLERYKEIAKLETNTYFCGRLANYQYFNMDQVVAQALSTFTRIAQEERATDSSALRYSKSRLRLATSSGLAPA